LRQRSSAGIERREFFIAADWQTQVIARASGLMRGRSSRISAGGCARLDVPDREHLAERAVGERPAAATAELAAMNAFLVARAARPTGCMGRPERRLGSRR
jgi:hypothetical protein